MEIVNVAPQEFTEEVIPEAFIFCPKTETVKVENLFGQVIFASEIKMSSMMETRNSMPVFFTTIRFNDEDINKNTSQRVEEYLQNAIANETAYKDSLMHVSGILSYK